ncbi:MAG: C39 family peptidase [Myxococcales bacterium]
MLALLLAGGLAGLGPANLAHAVGAPAPAAGIPPLAMRLPIDGASEPRLQSYTTGQAAPDLSGGNAIVQRTPTPRRPRPTATPRRPRPTATPRRPAPTATARPSSDGLPGRVLLPMPSFEYQKLNNCGPCVTLMALSVMGIETSQQRIADAMRPNKGDKNVSADEVVAYLGRYNLQSRVMVGVDVQRLRRLTAAGIPVIVEQLLATNDDISHFRLVRGYDDSKQVIITGDSYYAATYNINYKTFEQLSRMFNHRYMPVWHADQTATVQAILGDEWDPTVMYTHARDQAQAAVQASPNDAAWWLALGHSQYGLGNWDAAIKAYLKSVSLGGLTKRVLWYQWWPVTALNRAGRYAEAITWADGAIRSAGVYAEMRYERAFALHALNRDPEAVTELKQAVVDDPNYVPAKQLLATLQQ